MTTTSITGVTALVTGGGSGIGLGSAIRLAADGAHVTICGRTEDKLVAAVETISAAVGEGGSVRHVAADVTVEEQVAAAVAVAAEPTGGLGILFANAGGSFHMGAFADADRLERIRTAVRLRGTRVGAIGGSIGIWRIDR
jgi:NAD(P)-dependent dehydrogenase (short-subunit alcohol dehydrogenase family)